MPKKIKHKQPSKVVIKREQDSDQSDDASSQSSHAKPDKSKTIKLSGEIPDDNDSYGCK